MIEPKFIVIGRNNINKFFFKIFVLFVKYRNFFMDDYAPHRSGIEFFYSYILEKSPYFWVITGNGKFAGFVFLDEFVGSFENLHSAEITVCFEKHFWGKFTRLSAMKFFDYCFNQLKLKKIKVGIYPENNRIRGLLKDCGFKKEGLLIGETFRQGKLQDIEIFGLLNPNLKLSIN